MRILVGADGGGVTSRDAVALGATLARTYDAELVLGVVLPRVSLWEEAHSHEELLGSGASASFQRASEELERVAPGLSFERRAIGGESPGDGLRTLAARERADLIVIGSTHRGAIGRIFAGTTVDELIVRAPCPFAVAPRGYADAERRELEVVGLAYDGFAEARRAAVFAERLAGEGHMTLRVFGVLQPLVAQSAGGIGAVPMDTIAFRQQLDEELDALLADLPSGVDGEKRILAGRPATELIEQGPAAADLMVFGSRGFGRIMRVIGGSVSSEVVRGAPWPVVVVPPEKPLPFEAAGQRAEVETRS